MFCKSLRSSFAYKMLISCRWSDSPPRRLFPEIIKATEEWRTHTGALEELHDRPARSPNSPPFLHAVRQIGKHCLKSLSIRCEWWMASGQKVVDINRSAINLSKGNQLTRCQSLLHLTIFIIWIKRQNTIMINCRGVVSQPRSNWAFIKKKYNSIGNRSFYLLYSFFQTTICFCHFLVNYFFIKY